MWNSEVEAFEVEKRRKSDIFLALYVTGIMRKEMMVNFWKGDKSKNKNQKIKKKSTPE